LLCSVSQAAASLLGAKIQNGHGVVMLELSICTWFLAEFFMQVMAVGMKEMKQRIDSVKNTKKITDAMKLVAAAKVRRAQEAVVNGRPFSENLVKVCDATNTVHNMNGW
jgi:hypothetical protein